MDATRFDAIAQAMANGESRRGLVKMLAGSALGGFVLAGAGGTEAKKGGKGKGKGQAKKIEVCHSGATIKVSKKGKKKHLKHGDTIGPCGDGTTTTPQPDPCSDGVKNGNESDVDCGGSCGRCDDGKACNSRDDCKSALCVSGVCKSCEAAAECGFQADEVTGCGCRKSLREPGKSVCTNVNAENTYSGQLTCSLCPADQACAGFPPDDPTGTECFIYCGAT